MPQKGFYLKQKYELKTIAQEKRALGCLNLWGYKEKESLCLLINLTFCVSGLCVPTAIEMDGSADRFLHVLDLLGRQKVSSSHTDRETTKHVRTTSRTGLMINGKRRYFFSKLYSVIYQGSKYSWPADLI